MDEEAWRSAAGTIPDEPAERVRAIVGRGGECAGAAATVDIVESDEEIRATVNGDDLGLLIGKHGTTIDALQHLAFRAAFRGDGAPQAGDRRRGGLPRAARGRAPPDGRQGRGGGAPLLRPVELEPMRATERKIVHTYLSERSDVETHSEGDEPDRRLVVSPVERFS